MAVAAAQKNREMFAIKKSYSIEVSATQYIELLRDHHQSGRTVDLTCLWFHKILRLIRTNRISVWRAAVTSIPRFHT